MTDFPDRIISAKERRRMVPYSDVHIRRMENAGRFPRRIPLGPGRIGWRLSEVMQWIEDRTAERDGIVTTIILVVVTYRYIFVRAVA